MRRRQPQGFTLIELMISLVIFTIIALATASSLKQVVTTKTIAFRDLDMFSNTRTAIAVLRTDLTQAFHVGFDDLGPEAQQLLQQARPVAHTIFDGRKQELIFTALSHRVYYVGRRESEQTEISYFLQARQGAKFPSLMKRESEIVDADLFQGGAVYTILENVSDLQFQYWDNKTKKWLDDWSSDGPTARDTFPMAVKVKLTVTNNEGRPLSLETQLKVAFPNNEKLAAKF